MLTPEKITLSRCPLIRNYLCQVGQGFLKFSDSSWLAAYTVLIIRDWIHKELQNCYDLSHLTIHEKSILNDFILIDLFISAILGLLHTCICMYGRRANLSRVLTVFSVIEELFCPLGINFQHSSILSNLTLIAKAG